MLNKDDDSSSGAAAAAEEETTNTTTPLSIQRRSLTQDLSGLCRLSKDAIHKTTELVEAQHTRLDWFSNYIFQDRGGIDKTRNPIAAMVYNSIYTVNNILGTSMEFVVSRLEPLLGGEETAPSKRRETAIAILNGVVGDYLKEQQNPLAISMQWRALDDGNYDTRTDDNSTTTAYYTGTENTTTTTSTEPPPKKHFLLLIHGACNGPQDWWQEGHNHGIALSDGLEYCPIPLFLHYNTGLHISENGKLLSEAIQGLIVGDNTIDRPSFSIVAHSMGGLVARSACYYAAQQGQDDNQSSWIHNLKHLITMGAPHHGAMLERGGKLVDTVLGAHSFTEPLSWAGKIRSAGVTDLGYGNVRDEDWMGYSGICDNRKPTPLPSSSFNREIRTLAIAAVMGGANSSCNRLLGESTRTDGLVTEASALGRGHSNMAMNLDFDEQATFYNTGHVGLLSSVAVFKTMLCFLAD